MHPQLASIISLARNGDRQFALTRLQAFIDQYPEDSEGWLALGLLAMHPSTARSALGRALALKPGWQVAQRALNALPEEREGITGVSVEDDHPPVTEPSIAYSDECPEGEDEEAHTMSDVVHADSQTELDLSNKIEQACQTLWPFAPTRRNKRSIGDLLAHSEITRQDLQWVSRHARNQHVREAATLLLTDSPHELVDVSLSIKDALAMKWPFRQLNKPLGELLRSGSLQSRDLRRAAFFAKEATLREAARMALTRNLEQVPQAPRQENNETSPRVFELNQHKQRERFPMRIVNGDDYLANEIRRRESKMRRFAGYIWAILILGSSNLALILGVFPRMWYLCFLVLLVCALGVVFVRKLEAQVQLEIELFKQGHAAEIKVARYLREYLDDRWTLFRNVKLRGSNTDIDLVLLGPPGVFAIEIKAYKGTFRYKHGTFYRYSHRRWRSMQSNPGKQARATAGILHAYIKAVLHSDVWVEPRLVWAGPGALELVQPEVYVWYLNNLDSEMQRLKQLTGRLSSHKRAMVYGMLSGLSSIY